MVPKNYKFSQFPEAFSHILIPHIPAPCDFVAIFVNLIPTKC